jgi:hypothetical protein
LTEVPALCFITFSSLVYRAWLHVNQLPNVAIQILKAVSIYETVVLRLFVIYTAGGDCLASNFIDLPWLSEDKRTSTSMYFFESQISLGVKVLNFSSVIKKYSAKRNSTDAH